MRRISKMGSYDSKHSKNIRTWKEVIKRKRDIEKQKDKVEIEPPWGTKKIQGEDGYITKK